MADSASLRVNNASKLVTAQRGLLSDENALAEMRQQGLRLAAAHLRSKERRRSDVSNQSADERRLSS
jgi:hypothetical protein